MIEFAAPSVVASAELEESGPSLINETLAWERPNLDQVKVNVDAAYWKPRATCAWGFIVCDDKGEFVTATAGKLRHLRYALQAETEALVAAVEGVAALGLNIVVFESKFEGFGGCPQLSQP
jgi:hypothetical protein